MTLFDRKNSPSEERMWEGLPAESSRELTDEEINFKYTKQDQRIITETNREQLPNFVAALHRPDWMELRPFYQRRRRWDPIRQSRLIESFIMNIPIPPLFVFESDYAKYEVMDGQQRITTIRDFYSNNLRLQGLEQWPELNGRTYSTLPGEIRKGIDRRSISYNVLLKESASSSEGETLLRQQVFERLNTGGVKLSNQEIRNAIYPGIFNDLIMKLVKDNIFRKAWGLPPYYVEEETNPPESLLRNTTYSQMRDAEFVLRFFALRHAEEYRRGMAGFLDLYSVRARRFTEQDISFLGDLFQRTMALASEIYGDLIFRPWYKEGNIWFERPHVAFADAVMVGLSRALPHSRVLREKKEIILDQTKLLFTEHPQGTFTGQGNTKKDVQQRLYLYEEMLNAVLAQ